MIILKCFFKNNARDNDEGQVKGFKYLRLEKVIITNLTKV